MSSQETYHRHPKSPDTILNVIEIFSRHLSLETLIQTVIERTTHILNADRVRLFIFDEKDNWLWTTVTHATAKPEIIRFAIDGRNAGHVATHHQRANIADAYAEPSFNPAVDELTGYRTKSVLCLPLITSSEHFVGIIQALNKQGAEFFDQEDECILEVLSRHVALALERTQIYETAIEKQRLAHKELQEQQNYLKAVQRVSQAIYQIIHLDQLLETTLRTALEEVGAEGGSILLADAKNKQLVFQYSLGESPVSRGTTIPWDKGISGSVFQSGEPRITSNVQAHTGHYNLIDQNTESVTRDMITLPLQRWKGERIGVLNVLNKRVGRLDQKDLTLLSIISAFAASAIQHAQLFEMAAEKHRMDQSLRLAHDIQMSLLPRISSPCSNAEIIDLHAALLPAQEVGGDLYDYFPVNDEQIFFVIGDVAGKGVPAALFMAVTKTLVKAFARRGLQPHEVLTEVNEELCLNNDSCTFVTLFCGILNMNTGDLHYANAGHNSPFLVSKNGSIECLTMPGGMAAGIVNDAKFHTRTIKLGEFDSLLLYTDGITEAVNFENTFFTEDRLKETILTLRYRSSQEIVEGILEQINIFSDGQPQTDDIALINIKFKKH